MFCPDASPLFAAACLDLCGRLFHAPRAPHPPFLTQQRTSPNLPPPGLPKTRSLLGLPRRRQHAPPSRAPPLSQALLPTCSRPWLTSWCRSSSSSGALSCARCRRPLLPRPPPRRAAAAPPAAAPAAALTTRRRRATGLRMSICATGRWARRAWRRWWCWRVMVLMWWWRRCCRNVAVALVAVLPAHPTLQNQPLCPLNMLLHDSPAP